MSLEKKLKILKSIESMTSIESMKIMKIVKMTTKGSMTRDEKIKNREHRK
jgi:hypothetical protein